MTSDYIIDLFMRKAIDAGAEALRVNDIDQLNMALAEILSASESVYCPGVTDIEKEILIPADSRVYDFVHAAICVEEVFGGIAETGSLVCWSQSSKPVQAGLLPPHHVALVAAGGICEKFEDFFAICGDVPPTNITLETGPSRTADIELTLTIGVHGPERLTIIVF